MLWCVWLLMISAPLVWFRATETGIAPNHARWQKLIEGFLGFPREHPHLLIFAVLVVGGFTFRRRLKSAWDKVAGSSASLREESERTAFARALVWLGAALLVVLPFQSGAQAVDLCARAGIWVILALGLNITVGLAGLLVLGYAALYAVGAYSYAMCSVPNGGLHLEGILSLNLWSALPIACIAGALVGLVLGLPSLRLRGDYLAIVTLGFGETLRYVFKNLDTALTRILGRDITITGGENGIIVGHTIQDLSIGREFRLSKLTLLYYLILLFVALTIVFVERINYSRIGRAWLAIRDDELAAETMGIPTRRLKLLAFVLSAILGAVGGVLYAELNGFVDPESFRLDDSILVLSMVVLGGMGSTPGVIVGAVTLWMIPQLLRSQLPELQDYRLLIFGFIMVVMMIFRPQGLIPSKRRRLELPKPAPTAQ